MWGCYWRGDLETCPSKAMWPLAATDRNSLKVKHFGIHNCNSLGGSFDFFYGSSFPFLARHILQYTLCALTMNNCWAISIIRLPSIMDCSSVVQQPFFPWHKKWRIYLAQSGTRKRRKFEVIVPPSQQKHPIYPFTVNVIKIFPQLLIITR